MDSPRSQPGNVRSVPEQVRAPDDAIVSLDEFDADDVAPAIALMNINEPSSSMLGRPRQSASPAGVSSGNRERFPTKADAHPLRHTNQELQAAALSSREAHLQSSRRNSPPVDTKIIARRSSLRKFGVDSVLGLDDSEDTDYYVKQAPVVTHDTVVQPVHEVVHEVHDREIHEDEVYHRILPVEEVEVLPARHFVEDTLGGRREVSAQDVPGRAPRSLDRMLAQRLKIEPAEGESQRPRDFTARRFSGTEGNCKESVDRAGTTHTERWWVHGPRLEQSNGPDEDAYPVHFK